MFNWYENSHSENATFICDVSWNCSHRTTFYLQSPGSDRGDLWLEGTMTGWTPLQPASERRTTAARLYTESGPPPCKTYSDECAAALLLGHIWCEMDVILAKEIFIFCASESWHEGSETARGSGTKQLKKLYCHHTYIFCPRGTGWKCALTVVDRALELKI